MNQEGGGANDPEYPVRDREDHEWTPPCTLPVDYWKRSEINDTAKRDHLSRVDGLGVQREHLINDTILRDADVVLEVNMFPYDTPALIKYETEDPVFRAPHELQYCATVLSHLPCAHPLHSQQNELILRRLPVCAFSFFPLRLALPSTSRCGVGLS